MSWLDTNKHVHLGLTQGVLTVTFPRTERCVYQLQIQAILASAICDGNELGSIILGNDRVVSQ